jgi:hypothetical protein
MFELSISDRQSPLWQRWIEFLEERLDHLRKLNDHDSTEIETAVLRGRIAEIKTLISFNDESEHE